MKGKMLTMLVLALIAVLMVTPIWAQVEVTVEELDIGGNPPGLEGMPGVFLHNQDSGTDHLVVFGGCTEDWLWDQALVLDDVSGGFEGLSWTTVPVPGMGAVCEHVVAGPGDVAYLIGGFHDDFNTMRPMNEILEIRLTGSAANPVIETTEITVDCTECPEARVGHAAVWTEMIEGCDGGGVLFAGGMNNNWVALDDVWLFCPEFVLLENGNGSLIKSREMLLSTPDSDFGLVEDPKMRSLYRVTGNPVGKTAVEIWSKNEGRWKYHNANSHWVDPGVRGTFSVSILDNGDILLTGGISKTSGEPSARTYIYHVASGEWERIDDLPKAIANVFGVNVSSLLKQGGSSEVIVFGGVEDYHAPRILSNSTYLVTITDNGPSADYAVPAVAQVQGAGAFFTSVMHIYNDGATDLELEMSFTPRDGSGGEVTTVSHTVPAGVMQTIEAPLATLFGFGGGQGRVGSILITVTSGSAADLMAQTVVFAQLDTGEEYGQFFPAMRVADAMTTGQTAYLNTTEDPEHNRVNVGLMALADGTRFKVTPVDPLGFGLAAARTFDLDTGGNTQINNTHTAFGLGSTADVVVEVEVLSGSGLAYASVLDGSGTYAGTSDPTTILPVTGGSSKVTLLEIGSIQGLNEFSGSASVTNYSEQTAAIRADFFQRGDPGVAATQSLTIGAGDTVGYGDLGADLFGVSGDVGTVVLTATNGAEIGATGREFAIFRDEGEIIGTAGQLIAGQTDGDRLVAGTTYHFIGLRQERGGAVERSHFAVFNPGLADARVTVRLYDGAGGDLEGEASWMVAGRTLIQVNNVIRAIDPDHDNGEKRIEVEVDHPVFMNAFRVNRWGDPVTLSPFPG